MIVTKEGHVPIALQSTRIVHGGRGSYMEIADDDIIKSNLMVPVYEQWRQDEYWQSRIYYEWWVPRFGPQIKLYYQKKTVSYADYIVGYWYVDPKLVAEVADDDR